MAKREKINPETGEVRLVEDNTDATASLDQQPPMLRFRIRDLVIDDMGREIPDQTPLAPPVGYFKQPSMAELVREQVRSERLKQEAESLGKETFDESEDFEVGDDYDPQSPWENEYDPPIEEIKRVVAEEKARRPPIPDLQAQLDAERARNDRLEALLTGKPVGGAPAPRPTDRPPTVPVDE